MQICRAHGNLTLVQPVVQMPSALKYTSVLQSASGLQSAVLKASAVLILAFPAR